MNSKSYGIVGWIVVLGIFVFGCSSDESSTYIIGEGTESTAVTADPEGGGLIGADIVERSAPETVVETEGGPECEPLCDDLYCDMDDGCGGTCGCPEEALCNDGVCCVPQCENAVCGGDQCGGTCGECAQGETCEDGSCCVPDCSGKECGDDGCGGSCGACSDPTKPLCGEGVCVPSCIPNCVGKECGFDGCSGSCGLCNDLGKPQCNEDGICGPDTSCGPDGCVLTGQVLAPNGQIPIYGAEVYVQLAPPPAPNEKLHCDKCFQLPDTTPLALSDTQGMFELAVPKAGSYFLIVAKGGFRRVRSVEVTGGLQNLEPSLTTLPGTSNTVLGDSVPRMAVVGGGYDAIENTLTGLGIEYTMYEADSEGAVFLTDWDAIKEYQIIFLPCASGWFDSYLSVFEHMETLRSYVAAGGRLYVTDWSYDILVNAFPEPITYKDHDGTLGSAQGGNYDAPAKVIDPDMKEWLEYQGVEEFELEANWTSIEKVNTYEGPNELNMATMFDPTVWVMANWDGTGGGGGGSLFMEAAEEEEDTSEPAPEEETDASDPPPEEEPEEELEEEGDFHPATVSFQWGCGRALFSTYHTETSSFGGAEDLMPQEKALLFTILEVVLCIGPQ